MWIQSMVRYLGRVKIRMLYREHLMCVLYKVIKIHVLLQKNTVYVWAGRTGGPAVIQHRLSVSIAIDIVFID